MKELRDMQVFNSIYAVLEECAAAPPALRPRFLELADEHNRKDPFATVEFRFTGSLGTGGKVWITPESFHVTADSEDIDARPARQATINYTNGKLKVVFVPPVGE